MFLLALLLVLTVFDYLTLDSPVLKYDIVVVFSSELRLSNLLQGDAR